MRHLFVSLLIAMAGAACGRSAPPPTQGDEPETLSVTRWTRQSELFAEYPPLVVGRASRFAIHLTRLDSFAPVAEGQVEVQLRGGGQEPERFRVDAPSRPGIFGVDVTPGQAGTRELVIIIRGPALDDEHRVGEVSIHASAASVRDSGSSEEDGISFLKEQQWTLDFATAVVREQAVRESIPVPARIEARSAGAADVVAPTDGRLTRVADLTLGAVVSRGQELARLLPAPSTSAELPQLRRSHAEAASAFTLAVRDRERAERLTSAGAVPAKRLDEARAAEEQARVRLTSAEASLAQFEAARGGGVTDGEHLFVLRAPVSGAIAYRDAASGANVAGGTTLFRVVDSTLVQIVGQVPETQSFRIHAVTAAEMELRAGGDRVPAGRLIAIGKVLDAQSRTLPITFLFDNRHARLPVGQSLVLHLLMNQTDARPAVPAAALVDDGGRPVVFIQREGETFERRPVTLGARAGDMVQIATGVEAGERIVTKGAYLVRLASLSTNAPAHGHVH